MATEAEIDEVFNRTDDLLSAGDFGACDEYLDKLVHSDDLDILLAGLTSTWAAWSRLIYRDALIGRVRSLDKRPGLLEGLIPDRGPNPIQSLEDLEKAHARLDEIWNSPEGSPEREERNKLFNHIAVYEDQNYYIPEPDGEVLAQFRREQEGR